MMVPPFDAIDAELLIRFKAPSELVVLVSVMLPPFSVIPEVFSSAWLKPERAIV